MKNNVTKLRKLFLSEAIVPLVLLLSVSGFATPIGTNTATSNTASPASDRKDNGSGTASLASDPSNQIAFISSRDGNFEIYLMNADGTGQTRLTFSSYDDFGPVWSPDGKKIAYFSVISGFNQIFIMNADGSGQTRLSSPSKSDADPSWSPDGRRIAFHSTWSSTTEIYMMNSDGTNRLRLTNNSSNDYHAAWSPDGTMIAFTSERDGSAEIYMMNSDGSGQTRLTNNSANDSEPTWSPDGKFILFKSDRDGNQEIYRMYLNGLGQTRLTNNTGIDFEPSWACSGTKIVFASEMLGTSEIYTMNTDGTGITRLTNDPAWDRHPAWQPVYCLRPVAQIASSSALPDVLLISFKQSPTPLYSLNGGVNWQPVTTKPWLASFDPNNPNNHLHVAVVPRPGMPPRLIVAYDGTIYRTGDYGLTWAQATMPLWWGCDTLTESNDLVVSPADPIRLYLDQTCDHNPWGAFADRIFASEDAGVSWPRDLYIHYKPVPSPILAQRVYARWYDLGWYWEQSDDGGRTWSSDISKAGFQELALDAQNQNWLYVYWDSPYLGSRSIDDGANWSNWNEQPCTEYLQLVAHPTISNMLMLRCDLGLFGSQNGGNNWDHLSPWKGEILAADYGNPGRILWARVDGLWGSTDAGANFSNLTPDYLNHNFLPFLSK